MGKSYSKQVTTFSLEGRFLGFGFEDGYKLKYLRMATKEGECSIKLCKELRKSFELRLIPGDWLEVSGERKYDLKNGKLKLKAEQVIPATPKHEQTKVSAATKPANNKKASILVCQKSSCMKRGGKGVCQALEAVLGDRGLSDEVAIKGTGCLKQCKAGPNLVMPDKTRYSRIQAEEIPELIDKHFTAKSADEQPQSQEAAVVSADHFAVVK